MIPNLKALYISLFMLIALPGLAVNEINREFLTINAANDLADNSVEVIVCTKTGRMIISTLGNLNFYDGVSFTHIDTKLEYRMPLPQYDGDYKLYFDSFHHIWLKHRRGATCVDLTNETFIEKPDEVVKAMGCQEDVEDFFVDNDGNVWFLTHSGLTDAKEHRMFQPLRDHVIQDIDVFEKLLLVFYDNGEVIALDMENGQIVHHSKAYEWEDAQRYTKESKILRNRDEYYVIRSGEQESILLTFNVKRNSWTTMVKLPYRMNNMTLSGTQLYVASDRGYWIFDTEDGTRRHEEVIKLAGGRELITECNTITFDKQGGLWLGTNKRGVLYGRPRVTPIHCYEIDHPKAKELLPLMENLDQNITEFKGMRANCMFVDSRNWTWVGTMTGLYLYRKPHSEAEIFDRKNGLLNNVVHAIVEDKHHNIWASTSCGIAHVLFENGEIVFVNNFNIVDDVPNESFINCKALCLNDGNIIMQSIDHVLEFNPDSFKIANTRRPIRLYPKLVRLMVNGFFVQPNEVIDGRVIIDRAITRVREINVGANQNSLSLTFSSLNYFRPLQSFYRVRIPEIDNEWRLYSYFNGTNLVDNNGMLHLPLVGMKPGDYHIEVQASMFPDIWDGIDPYVWVLHVHQPWWQARVAYVVFLVLICVVIIINFVIYNRNTRMKARRNLEESDMIRKIMSFVERCDSFSTEILAPGPEELHGELGNSDEVKLSAEFVEKMMKLIPFIHNTKDQLTMSQLSEVAGMTIVELHNMMTDNMHKSPKALACQFRLERAAEMLLTTDKSADQISTECGFHTPNYFMGCFFHRYKLTTREYQAEYRK
jgi:AraC-like DNA-binding protein